MPELVLAIPSVQGFPEVIGQEGRAIIHEKSVTQVRGVRLPHAPRGALAEWWMLLAILSNQGSLLGMVRFAKRHRKALNELLGTHIASPPSDSTFRLLLAKLDMEIIGRPVAAVDGSSPALGLMVENAADATLNGLRPTASALAR